MFQMTLKVQELADDAKNYSLVYLPIFHYPNPSIISTGGRVENDKATGLLFWWHDAKSAGQSHTLTITQGRP